MVFRRIGGIILLALSWRCAGAPQQSPSGPRGLADASLEELMDIEVTSVSKKTQRLSSTAASAFVITAEDIRRSGLTELPEILRLAPGVQIARLESGRWAVSIRGFTSDFSNKLLVLVDGRSVYSEVQPGVMWDMVHVAVDNIERIEVIRGPNSAIWGDNAVNGVINIITRSAKETQGTMITAEAGTAEGNAVARFGGAAGPNAFYRIGADYSDQAAAGSDGTPISRHGWNKTSFDFRMDWNPTVKDSVLVAGQGYHSVIGHDLVNPSASNPFPGSLDVQESSFSGNAFAHWQHNISEQSSIEWRVSWDRMNYGGAYAPQREGSVDVQFQHHVFLGNRNDVVWGLEFRQATAYITATPNFYVLPAHSERDLASVFAEDQIALVPGKLQFIIGVRAGYEKEFHVQVQPTGRLLWTPTSRMATWVAVSRAIHTPSVFERGFGATLAAIPLEAPLFGLVQITSNPNSRPESALSYEAGQRIQIHRQLSLDASAFYTVYQHLLGQQNTASYFVPESGTQLAHVVIPILDSNVRHGTSEGIDLSATRSANSRWKLTGGYSWLRIHALAYPGVASSGEVTNGGTSPQHQYQVRSNLNLTRTLQLDTAAFFVSKLPGVQVPSHLRGDVRIGWRPMDRLELSVGVQDALTPQHVELLSSRLTGLAGIHRNVYGRVTWRF
jgi:iron complex outermembrane receptor protein